MSNEDFPSDPPATEPGTPPILGTYAGRITVRSDVPEHKAPTIGATEEAIEQAIADLLPGAQVSVELTRTDR